MGGFSGWEDGSRIAYTPSSPEESEWGCDLDSTVTVPVPSRQSAFPPPGPTRRVFFGVRSRRDRKRTFTSYSPL